MKLWVVAVLALLLQACGGGSSAPDPNASGASCTVQAQRQSLRDYMNAQYYWYAQMPQPDESATSMDAYFQSMLFRPLDRYSFTETTAAHDQLFVAGRKVGYGYSLVFVDAAQTDMRVRYVEPQSPVARAGLLRGDMIVTIDGFTPQQIAQGALAIVDTVGVLRHFVVRSVSGQLHQIDVASEDFPLQPVATTATFDATRNGAPVKVGYIDYTQFVNYSFADLSTAFARFNNAGIGELILDLRYNGGGSVATSRDLASMIGGTQLAGQLFAYLRFNDKQSASTTQVRFNAADVPFAQPMPGGLQRLIVLTSGGTASASELLINGLKPFIDVVLIGDTTYGKPYGFVPRDDCGITYDAVNFESLNSLGVGNFTSGFAPTCAVPDDFTHQLGDAGEGRTHAALSYIATGQCPVAGTALGAPKLRVASPVFGETVRPQMFP